LKPLSSSEADYNRRCAFKPMNTLGVVITVHTARKWRFIAKSH